MRFGPEITEQEYLRALRAEVAAAFGEGRAREDEAQLESAAHALRLVAEVDVPALAEDPFFLGMTADG